METLPTPPPRPGTPGLDVFKIAGRSISGFVHSFKTGDPRRVRQPFTSRLEEQLCLFLEYHPHVRYYQRGDASPACATAYDLASPLGTPYRVNYVFEGKPPALFSRPVAILEAPAWLLTTVAAAAR